MGYPIPQNFEELHAPFFCSISNSPIHFKKDMYQFFWDTPYPKISR